MTADKPCPQLQPSLQEDRKEIQRNIWQMIRLYYRSRTKDFPVMCFDRNLYSMCLRKIFTELELKNLGRCLSTSFEKIQQDWKMIHYISNNFSGMYYVSGTPT